MSLLNAWIDYTSGLLVVDTQACGYGSKTGLIRDYSKALFIPHAQCVVAARGNQTFLLNLFGLLADKCRDADEIVQMLPALGRAAREAHLAHGDDMIDTLKTYIVVMGWPKTLLGTTGGMFCKVFERPSPEKDFVGRPAPATCAPAMEAWKTMKEPPARPALSDLKKFCGDQVRDWQRTSPEEAAEHPFSIGGDLLAFEMTENNIKVTNLGSFL